MMESVQHQWVTQKDSVLIFQFGWLNAFWKPISGSPLSRVPHHLSGTWQHSWLHHHVAYSLLHTFLLACVLPSGFSSGGHPADFAVLHPNLLQGNQVLASSSLWSAVVSCPKLQFAVPGAMTDSIFHLLAVLSPPPAHVAHLVLCGQPSRCETPWLENWWFLNILSPPCYSLVL